MECIREGLRARSWLRAEREVALNSSEPQKRILRGSEVFLGVVVVLDLRCEARVRGLRRLLSLSIL